jgi:hypothetical protein
MNDYKRVLLVVLTAILLFPIGFAARNAINDSGEKNARMFNTAIQATEQDRFNYAIDSHQGKLIGSGVFTPTESVKFPEMSKDYGYVQKSKEEYTEHESCTTDEDGNETCSTYYTWDGAGSEELESNGYKLHDRVYPASLFNTGVFASSIDCSEFMGAGGGDGWFETKHGCLGGYYYTDDDTRYDYRVIGKDGFSAAFISDVSNGTLAPVSGSFISLERKSVEQMVKDANDYKTGGNVFIVFWWILILAGAGGLAYAWAMNDGRWS